VRRLVIRPGAIGDFIVSLPALECLKCDYLEAWTSAQNAVLAQVADKARTISSTGLDLLGIAEPPAKLIEELRAFDSIVSWYGANRRDFIELTEQFGLKITFLRALPDTGAEVHAVDFYLDQVRGIGARSVEPVPRLRFDNVEPGDYAVIHPFSGSPKKNWPLRKFEAMARTLSRAMPVRWCAGPEDPPLERLIAPEWQVVRIGDLASLGRWLAGARARTI
jgi:ADP-heptose:LPS heptosyltransferase